jgi:hypothetical protein
MEVRLPRALRTPMVIAALDIDRAIVDSDPTANGDERLRFPTIDHGGFLYSSATGSALPMLAEEREVPNLATCSFALSYSANRGVASWATATSHLCVRSLPTPPFLVCCSRSLIPKRRKLRSPNGGASLTRGDLRPPPLPARRPH